MTILDIVLAELELSEPTALIELDIARVIQQVKNYCNLDVLPEALNFTVADMVVDLQHERSGECINFTDTDMGDTSYSFSVDDAIDNLVRDYKSNLNAFRRLRW